VSSPEYARIQAEITRLKKQLNVTNLPAQMKGLFEQCRPYKYWAENFNYPMHPLLAELEEVGDTTVSFDFNGNRYLLHFHSEPVPWDILTERGILRVLMNGESVLESVFFGESGEHSMQWRYSDSEVYKPGDWTRDLLKFKTESNELIELFRAQQDAAQKRDPARLKAMRDKFNLPESPPSKAQEIKKLFGQVAQTIFRR
jgi:hypothetical protein